MMTFYLLQGSRDRLYRNAPRMVFISWDHDYGPYADCSTLLDIKKILCRFIRHGRESDIDFCYNGSCLHEETISSMCGSLRSEYAYLDALNDFLSNNNAAWFEAVRAEFQHPLAVHCTIGRNCRVPTIYIHFEKSGAPPQLDSKRMYSSAAAYLRQLGIMDLGLRAKLDFIVGISSGKCMRPSTGASPLWAPFNQTHISGRTYRGLSGTAKAVMNNRSGLL